MICIHEIIFLCSQAMMFFAGHHLSLSEFANPNQINWNLYHFSKFCLVLKHCFTISMDLLSGMYYYFTGPGPIGATICTHTPTGGGRLKLSLDTVGLREGYKRQE